MNKNLRILIIILLLVFLTVCVVLGVILVDKININDDPRGATSKYSIRVTSSEGTEPSEPSEPVSTEGQEQPSEPLSPEGVSLYGTISCEVLNIRSGPGVTHDIVRGLVAGERVHIMELIEVNGSQWGRVSDGWICLDYVVLDGAETPEPAVYGTVICEVLNIRAGAGTSYDIVGTLREGQRVAVFEQKNAEGYLWGRISSGWVWMDHILLDGQTLPEPEEPLFYGTVICEVLNIRAGAGTDYDLIGTYTEGTHVPIYELRHGGGYRWGRTDRGWVWMDHILEDDL